MYLNYIVRPIKSPQCISFELPNGTPQELKFPSFHELASVNKLADVLNVNLIVKQFFE